MGLLDWLSGRTERLMLVALRRIILNTEDIMATQAQLQAALESLKYQLTKVAGEINAQVQALRDALAAAGTTTPEVDAALADVQTAVQALDDLNPDA